jgi:hypothetical protein
MKSRKPQAFGGLRDLEQAFAEFDRTDGQPDLRAEPRGDWSAITASGRLEYARSLNNFADLVTNGKFPPRNQFVIFCALHVFGLKALEYWREIRGCYCRGKPRGSHAITDEALDLWYAIDAWLLSWLYSPSNCRRPSTESPAAWLYCIGSNDPTPHLRMSHAFLRRARLALPADYVTARRNLLDVKGVFQGNVLVENGATVPNIRALLHRFPLMGWDIWQRATYLMTSPVKPPSHFPIYGWRHYRVLDFVRRGRLLIDEDAERALLGTPASLHGLLWPQQIETLRKVSSVSRVKVAAGPPVNSGRMLRRQTARE